MLKDPQEVLPGTYLLKLPLPFELNAINLYLIPLSDGWLLVDCGLDNEESFRALTGALEKLNAPMSSIKQILLTHMHPDHVGLAARMLELTGAKLLMHKEEARQLAMVASGESRPIWLDGTLRSAGVPHELIDRIRDSFDRMQMNFRKLDPDRILEGGESIDSSLGPLEVVCTPGHSPGHICLYNAAHRTLFSGDHILPGITPHIGWVWDGDALGDYLESLERTLQLDVGLILPSHGRPFADHRGWTAATLRHHEERCEKILTAAASPRTAHDLVAALWDRPLAPVHHRFAVFEVLAHVEYLARRGRLLADRSGGVIRHVTC